MYFEDIFLLILTIRIKELNFWWEYFPRKQNTTSNNVKLNLNINCEGALNLL